MGRIPTYLSDNEEQLLDDYCEKTGVKRNQVLRRALVKFLCNHEHKTELAKEVAMAEVVKSDRLHKQAEKIIMSAGHGAINLRQAHEKIDNMPIPEAQKDVLYDIAERYDYDKSQRANKISVLVSEGSNVLATKKENGCESVVQRMRRTGECSGCSWENKAEEFCVSICHMAQAKQQRLDEARKMMRELNNAKSA